MLKFSNKRRDFISKRNQKKRNHKIGRRFVPLTKLIEKYNIFFDFFLFRSRNEKYVSFGGRVLQSISFSVLGSLDISFCLHCIVSICNETTTKYFCEMQNERKRQRRRRRNTYNRDANLNTFLTERSQRKSIKQKFRVDFQCSNNRNNKNKTNTIEKNTILIRSFVIIPQKTSKGYVWRRLFEQWRCGDNEIYTQQWTIRMI